VDHLVIPAGASAGAHLHREVAEFYYAMTGEGSATVGGETAPIRAGDAIPIQLGETHAFENTGAGPLEFLIVGVSRDNTRRVDVVEPRAVRR
jgi:mannose-6-phosphate isomerase-like protein (cupin superfamily)